MHSASSISTIFNALSEWVALIEPVDQKIQWANQSFMQDFVQCQDIVGQSFSKVTQNQCFIFNGKNPLETTIQTGQQCQGEFFLVEGQGETRVLQVSTTPMKSSEGKIEQIVWLCRDISHTINVDDKIRYLAFHDPLTGLYNRNMFCDRLRQALVHAKRERQLVALIYLDLDLFKDINDSFGHSAGDLLLRDSAKRIHSCVRENDTVARIGGDEFVILFSCHKRDEIDVVVQKIMDCFDDPFNLEGRTVPLTGSVGVALYPDDADAGNELMKRADHAMYNAKSQGPHSCQFYSNAIAHHGSLRRGLTDGLKNCVAGVEPS